MVFQHLVRFFLEELAAGRLPREFLPLQSGVGNVENALPPGLGKHTDLPAFTLFTEDHSFWILDLPVKPTQFQIA
jgi:propionyl-CoA:succinyl-CoA transferase